MPRPDISTTPGRKGAASREGASKREGNFDRLLTYAVILSFQGYVFFTPFSIAGTQICLFLGVFVWLIRLVRGTGVRPRRLGVEWPILAFLASSILSTVLAVDPARSFINLKKFFLLGILYYTAYQWSVPRRFKLGVITLIFSSGATAVVALISFVVYPETTEAGRAVTPFSTSMTTGNVVMLLALVTGAQLLYGRHKGWLGALVGFSFASQVALLFLTFTRSSWVAFSVGAMILLGFVRKPLALAIPVLLILIYFVGPNSFRERASTVWDPDYFTNKQRIELFKGSVSIAKESPVWGVGLMDLGELYAEHRPEGAKAIHGHMHNIFLQIVVSQGVIGLLAFIVLLLALFRIVWDASRLHHELEPLHRAWVIGSVGAFFAFLVSGLFDWTFGDSEVVMLLYLILGGAAACLRAGVRRLRLRFLSFPVRDPRGP